jgi:hypothetical protein
MVIPSSGNREKRGKAENEVEKKQRRRKKVPNKTVEKREQAKEKRRGRSSLTSIAKKKAAGQVSAKLQKDSKSEQKLCGQASKTGKQIRRVDLETCHKE